MANNKLTIWIRTLLDKRGARDASASLDDLTDNAKGLGDELEKSGSDQTFLPLSRAIDKLSTRAKNLKASWVSVWSTKEMEQFKSKFDSVIKKAQKAQTAVKNIWNSKPVASFRIAVTAVFAAIGLGSIKAAGDMEQLQLQLETVLGDAERAKQAFEESFDFSVATPFSPEEIVQTRIALESVGVAGQDAVGSIATAAAAMGRNILDVASAVRSLETEPIRNLGISLKRSGEQFVFEYKDALGRANEVTATGFASAQQTLLDILGSRFEGGLEKMSSSLGGKLSTMFGNIKAGLADFGDGFLSNIKSYIDSINEGINKLRDSGDLQAAGEAVGIFLDSVVGRLEDVINKGKVLYEYLKTGGDIADVMEWAGLKMKGHIKNGFQVAVNYMAAKMPQLGTAFASSAWSFVKNRFKGPSNEAQEKAAGDVAAKHGYDPASMEWLNHHREIESRAKVYQAQLDAQGMMGDYTAGPKLGDSDLAQADAKWGQIQNDSGTFTLTDDAGQFTASAEEIKTAFEAFGDQFSETTTSAADALQSAGLDQGAFVSLLMELGLSQAEAIEMAANTVQQQNESSQIITDALRESSAHATEQQAEMSNAVDALSGVQSEQASRAVDAVEATAETAQEVAELIGTSAEMAEGSNRASEAMAKSAEKVAKASTSITQQIMINDQNVEQITSVMQASLATQQRLAGAVIDLQSDLRMVETQLRSMRA